MNGDRLWDLAIGAPGASVNTGTTATPNLVASAGNVQVLYGAPASQSQQIAGLGPTGSQAWNQNVLKSNGDDAEANEKFGSALTIGDFNGDHIADLAVQTPAESFNDSNDGTANIIFAASNGLNVGGTGNLTPHQIWLSSSTQMFPDPARQRLLNDPTQPAKNLQAGKDFLAANKVKPGVITLADGLQYKVISSNPGGAQPTDNNSVTVDYTGSLIDGTIFDTSSRHPTNNSFNVTGVVPGFAEALKLMHVGDHIIVYIPANLGYGANGSPPGVPANSVLIFDLHLISIGAPI